jgi:hypothetical protein
MGEHLLRILLKELDSARVRCAKCFTAVEMPITSIGKLDNEECPGCGKQFGRGSADLKAGLHGEDKDRLTSLSDAIKEVLSLSDIYTLERDRG